MNFCIVIEWDRWMFYVSYFSTNMKCNHQLSVMARVGGYTDMRGLWKQRYKHFILRMES